MTAKRTTVDEYASLAMAKYGRLELTRAEIFALNAENDILTPFRLRAENQGSKRGYFKVPYAGSVAARPPVAAAAAVSPAPEAEADAAAPLQNVVALPTEKDETRTYIPAVDPSFIAWGNAGTIDRIVRSKKFYPMFITGLSGNGKTFGVEQACAKANREFIRVNITVETDEDDLIGGMRLINGDTVFQEGPVVEAMRRGAVLLLDEIDLASPKIMILQPVLEGKPIFLKKAGRYVAPAPGFTVIATANTKGKGSSSGHFVGTQVLNEAFLDRFPVMLYQPYADAAVETKILNAALTAFGGLKDEEASDYAVKVLVRWANKIRAAFDNGTVADTMTTRRLVNILNGMVILGGKSALTKSVELSVERFDDDTKKPFLDFFKSVVVATDEEIKQAKEAAERLKAQQEALARGDTVTAAPSQPTSGSSSLDPALASIIEKLKKDTGTP